MEARGGSQRLWVGFSFYQAFLLDQGRYVMQMYYAGSKTECLIATTSSSDVSWAVSEIIQDGAAEVVSSSMADRCANVLFRLVRASDQEVIQEESHYLNIPDLPLP